MATDEDHPTIERPIGGSETEAALGKYVGPTDSPRQGERGTYQIKRANFEELESDRIIGNVPDRETAERLTGNLSKAEERHRERSARARTVDEQKKAKLTTDYEAWAANPRRLDFPGVDTPGVAGSYRDQGPRRPGAFDWGAPTAIGGAGKGEYEYSALEDLERGPGQGSQPATPANVASAPGLGELERHHVSDWGTDDLFSMRERKMEGHSKARAGQKARGVRPGKTDYSDDDLMRDYLADVRAIDKELYDRGALG